MGNSGLNSLDDAEREGWIRAQKVAFTAWVNFQLEEFEGGQDSKGGEERRKVVDLYEDLKDGLVLLRLIRAVSGQTPSGKVTQKPRMKIQCTENIQFFMDILKKLSIRTENIGAEDIYSGNQNIILGLIYTLILRFGGVTRQSPSAVASGISASESLSSSSSKSSSSTPPSPSSSKDTSIDKNDLLEWCNTRCEAYGVHVDNFTSSWADGRGFSALTASLVAGFGYQEATTDPSASLGSSFEAIESGLRVPQMLVPELMVSPYSPDERSVITYLSAIRSKYGEAPLIAPVESEPEPEPEPLDFDVTGDGLRDGLAAIERRVRVKIAGDGASVEAAQLRVVDEDGNEVPVTAIRVDEHTVEFRYLATEEGTLRILGSYEGEALFEKTVTIEPAEASSFALEALQEVAKV
ncbi:MAG: hypothetical protein Q8P67_22945, partial [archaeon]|nr:hypothetical protein [archaeon]